MHDAYASKAGELKAVAKRAGKGIKAAAAQGHLGVRGIKGLSDMGPLTKYRLFFLAR